MLEHDVDHLGVTFDAGFTFVTTEQLPPVRRGVELDCG